MNESKWDRAARPALPADHTFVVQFREPRLSRRECLPHGRIEHLVTGMASSFDTWGELHTFVEHVLLEAVGDRDG